MKKHKKLLITAVVLAVLVVAASFLLRWAHTRLLQKMYPRPYAETVVQEAEANGIDPNLVYAVIRQESRFNAEAKSSAGAIGLMQLTPATFEWLQKKETGTASFSSAALYEPKVNIHYGCRYLGLLMKKYGAARTALCAYNAGPGRVDQWLEDASLSSDGKSLSSIPYAETDDYMRKVEQNYEEYKALYSP
jgi:soluble lytic murein transglycosylase